MERGRWGSPPPWYVEEARRKAAVSAAMAGVAPAVPASAWEAGWSGQSGPSSVPAPLSEDHPPGFPTAFGRGPPQPSVLPTPILPGPPDGFRGAFPNPGPDPPRNFYNNSRSGGSFHHNNTPSSYNYNQSGNNSKARKNRNRDGPRDGGQRSGALAPPPAAAESRAPAGAGAAGGMTCFACHGPGHFQSGCKNPPFCLICCVDGHLTVECPNRIKPPSYKMYGYALPGCGFFGMEGSVTVVMAPVQTLHEAVMRVLSEEVPIQLIQAEIIDWDADGWDWQLCQIAPKEFSLVFPTAESLTWCTRGANFTLPRNNIQVKVVAAVNGKKHQLSLSEAWVLLDDVPPEMRNAPSMMAFSELIGKPIQVDEASLDGLSSVRVKVWCRFPERIRGFLEVYPQDKGFRINLSLESPSEASNPRSAASHKPDDPHKDDRNDPKDDEPRDHNTDKNSDSTPFSESVWNNMGPNAQKLYPNRKPVGKGAGAAEVDLATAAGVFDNILASAEGHISVCSNIPVRMASPSLSAIVDSPARETFNSPVRQGADPFKVSRLSPRSRAEVGWESPPN